MRALLALPCLLTGGTEVSTLATAGAFQKLGFSVDVLVYFDEIDPQMLSAFEGSGVNVIQLRLRRAPGLLAAWHLAAAILRFLWRRCYDLVWVQYLTPTLIPLLLFRAACATLLSAVHVAPQHYSPAGRARILWLAKHWCTRFVCVSYSTATGLFGAHGRQQRGIAVIPNAVDFDQLMKAPTRDWHSELPSAHGAVIIGFVGRLVSIKGADVLLKAISELVRAGKDVRAVIVGEGPEKHNLIELSKALGVEGQVHFAGPASRTGVFAALRGMDIAVVPSREEGFGLSALEAMAAGVPVVASDIDALRELVLENQTGLLFKPSDSGQLASALGVLIDDKQLRAALAANASSHASSYSSDKYTERISVLLNGLRLNNSGWTSASCLGRSMFKWRKCK